MKWNEMKWWNENSRRVDNDTTTQELVFQHLWIGYTDAICALPEWLHWGDTQRLYFLNVQIRKFLARGTLHIRNLWGLSQAYARDGDGVFFNATLQLGRDLSRVGRCMPLGLSSVDIRFGCKEPSTLTECSTTLGSQSSSPQALSNTILPLVEMVERQDVLTWLGYCLTIWDGRCMFLVPSLMVQSPLIVELGSRK